MKTEYIVALISALGVVIASIIGAIASLKKEKSKEDDNLLKEIANILHQNVVNDKEKKVLKNLTKNDDVDEKQMITILNENGIEEKVEVIFAFEFKDNKNEYIVYTKDEHDKYGNVTVYVSHVDRSTGEPLLEGIDDEKEWERIKEVLIELSRDDNGNLPPKPPMIEDNGIEVI